jgi:hypothetical protein
MTMYAIFHFTYVAQLTRSQLPAHYRCCLARAICRKKEEKNHLLVVVGSFAALARKLADALPERLLFLLAGVGASPAGFARLERSTCHIFYLIHGLKIGEEVVLVHAECLWLLVLGERGWEPEVFHDVALVKWSVAAGGDVALWVGREAWDRLYLVVWPEWRGSGRQGVRAWGHEEIA